MDLTQKEIAKIALIALANYNNSLDPDKDANNDAEAQLVELLIEYAAADFGCVLEDFEMTRAYMTFREFQQNDRDYEHDNDPRNFDHHAAQL